MRCLNCDHAPHDKKCRQKCFDHDNGDMWYCNCIRNIPVPDRPAERTENKEEPKCAECGHEKDDHTRDSGVCMADIDGIRCMACSFYTPYHPDDPKPDTIEDRAKVWLEAGFLDGLLDCAVCGASNAFVISRVDSSEGYCAAEGKV